MQKERLTLENIKKDLRLSTNGGKSDHIERYISGVILTTIISAIFYFALKMVWFGSASLILTAYFIVNLCQILRKKDYEIKQIGDVDDRLDIAISVEKLSHLSTETETVYVCGKTHFNEVWYLHFSSGASWRIPNAPLYTWSKEYYLSPTGMKNIAVPGNEYYFVTLQRNGGISYVYPCDFFEPDESLKKREE